MAEVDVSRSRKRPRLSWDAAPPEHENSRGNHSPPWREDDREGHYVFELGENLTPRYKIISKMGEGTFGRVLECWDREAHEYVAIKVVRSIRKYRHAAMIEIDVLKQLAENGGRSHCLQIRGWFDYRNHICIVCEKLGPSLFDFLRRNRYCPFPVDLVRDFGRQLLESVACLGWNYPCDMWSIGCILVEFCTGEALFQTHENLEHLAMMERVLGLLPENMVRKVNSSAVKYFKRGARLNWPEGATSRESIRAVRKLDGLKELIYRNVDYSRASLSNLLSGLLRYDHCERLTAHEALNHPFFSDLT